jgi:hypothetical protein
MEDENVSPLTPDERALYVENVRDAIRIVEGYPGEPDFMVPLLRGLNGLADKLEAEPEPTWRQQDGGEVGDEPLRFTIRWDHVTHSYRVSVPNLSGSLQVVPADAYDDMRRERDEAREALRELRDAAVLAREKSWMDDALNRRFREAINNAAVPLRDRGHRPGRPARRARSHGGRAPRRVGGPLPAPGQPVPRTRAGAVDDVAARVGRGAALRGLDAARRRRPRRPALPHLDPRGLDRATTCKVAVHELDHWDGAVDNEPGQPVMASTGVLQYAARGAHVDGWPYAPCEVPR